MDGHNRIYSLFFFWFFVYLWYRIYHTLFSSPNACMDATLYACTSAILCECVCVEKSSTTAAPFSVLWELAITHARKRNTHAFAGTCTCTCADKKKQRTIPVLIPIPYWQFHETCLIYAKCARTVWLCLSALPLNYTTAAFRNTHARARASITHKYETCERRNFVIAMGRNNLRACARQVACYAMDVHFVFTFAYRIWVCNAAGHCWHEIEIIHL